jgi:hypothetical protein
MACFDREVGRMKSLFGWPTGFCLLLIAGSAAAQPSASSPSLEQLQKRAAGLLPSKDQLRYQEIPWVHDLGEAFQIARAEERPVFLWGYGGRGRPDNGLEGC